MFDNNYFARLIERALRAVLRQVGFGAAIPTHLSAPNTFQGKAACKLMSAPCLVAEQSPGRGHDSAYNPMTPMAACAAEQMGCR